MFKWVYFKVEINNVQPGHALKCGRRGIADTDSCLPKFITGDAGAKVMNEAESLL